jgi:hypothetical protein
MIRVSNDGNTDRISKTEFHAPEDFQERRR